MCGSPVNIWNIVSWCKLFYLKQFIYHLVVISAPKAFDIVMAATTCNWYNKKNAKWSREGMRVSQPLQNCSSLAPLTKFPGSNKKICFLNRLSINYFGRQCGSDKKRRFPDLKKVNPLNSMNVSLRLPAEGYRYNETGNVVLLCGFLQFNFNFL